MSIFLKSKVYYRVQGMKSNVGIIKEIDPLGRIVIPKEFRERLMLDKRVEVVLTERGVLIRNSEYELINTRGSEKTSEFHK